MNLNMKQEKVQTLKEISSKSREIHRISDWKIIPYQKFANLKMDTWNPHFYKVYRCW